MSKDPAFLFYPGDYLRDTQTLSEKSQVAYDRIICEHMRNICISQSQLKFFTKRLSEDEIEELMFVLTKVNGGYQITWVAESITKRRAYSDSRRKNREGKPKEDIKDISETYDEHMENEDEIEIKRKKEKELKKKYNSFIKLFNKITGKKNRGDKKSEPSFYARLKEGYNYNDFELALTNCFNDKHHKENPHHLTPEFITRQDKLEKWLNARPKDTKTRKELFPQGY